MPLSSANSSAVNNQMAGLSMTGPPKRAPVEVIMKHHRDSGPLTKKTKIIKSDDVSKPNLNVRKTDSDDARVPKSPGKSRSRERGNFDEPTTR